ncbi:hypothetical protein BpHYR1_003659 [Brachionus plicatilis]|uniref:Uncharacterized protein n=1 Tax=Brachionus plicatilis TaxID=10195 RepID=A0A3M7PX63_BRAPC|nr:hypothetical protein BpHYR1_003659 [Brachionus plicatilis]
MSLPMTSESALLLSPGSKRKNEERQNCSKFYAESTSTKVLANHLKVEHNVSKPSFQDSDSEFENITSPKVIRVSDQSRITDLIYIIFQLMTKLYQFQPIMLKTWSALGKCSVVLMKIECILDVLYIFTSNCSNWPGKRINLTSF